MKEYVAASCPKCSKFSRTRRDSIGRNVSCKHCGNVFKIPPGDEISRLRDEIVTAQREADARAARYADEMTAARRDFESETSRLQTDAEALQRRLDQTQGRLEDEVLRVQDDRSCLQGELDTARAESVRLRRDFEQAQADQAAVAGALERLQSTHRDVVENHCAEIAQVRAERDQVVTALTARLREAEEQIERLCSKGRSDAAAQLALEADLAEKNAEIDDLRQGVRDAQRFKKEMATFLSGMGIRLPG